MKNLLIAAVAASALCGAADAAPTLGLARVRGNDVTIEVRLSGLGGQAVAGYQVFLTYDPGRFAFSGGVYGPSFGLPLISPISGSAGQVQLAAGINTFVSQPPVTGDTVLATLHFTPLVSDCNPAMSIRADAIPPTRLTDPSGQAIPGVTLMPLNRDCVADYNGVGGIELLDIFDFLEDWFAGNCYADVNNQPGVELLDIFYLLEQWFSRCM